MIRMKQTSVTGPMDRTEAQAITDRIRGHIDAAWKDLVRARDGKAWKALGYPAWEAYVKAEFGISDRHARRLLEQGEVIAAIEDATGPMGPLSERAARELRDDLPAAVEQIKERSEKGEEPAAVAKEIAAAKRAAKAKAKAEREAQQAEYDALRDEHAAKLPAFVAEREEAKADAIAARKSNGLQENPRSDGLTPEDRIAELEEAVAVLEKENADLKAENKLYGEMKAQFAQGGFDKVITGKDEEIRVLQSRLYQESADKASWMRSAKYWNEQAIKHGYSRNTEIDLQTLEIVNG